VLKPPNEQPGGAPGGGEETPVGDLVHELVEEGKAYAKAEFDVVKAIAAAKAEALKLPGMLFATAFLLGIAAITALSVGVAVALATLVGPLAGGVLAFLLFAGIAGVLGWYGLKRLQEDL
jgi:hypothetical protein